MVNKADIEHYPLGPTQGVPFKQLSLLSRLGLVSILGFHSPLGSPCYSPDHSRLSLCGDRSFLERGIQSVWFPFPQDLGVLSVLSPDFLRGQMWCF